MTLASKALVFDVDGTLCPLKQPDQKYEDLVPYPEMVEKLRAYKNDGYRIILHTSRHMRTTEGNLGVIIGKYSHVMLAWLSKHKIPYDELHFGKPWPTEEGFYVDDRAVRPAEFLSMNAEEIRAMLKASAR